jgi:hypothetical protein
MCTYFLTERLPNGLDVVSSGHPAKQGFYTILSSKSLSLSVLCEMHGYFKS